MAKPRINPETGENAVNSVLNGDDSSEQKALAVRYLLQVLEGSSPGHSVELRVPPFGAIQFGEGPKHTRGTPPNVIEMSAETWLSLATGSLRWREAVDGAFVSASGTRADLGRYLPLNWERIDT